MAQLDEIPDHAGISEWWDVENRYPGTKEWVLEFRFTTKREAVKDCEAAFQEDDCESRVIHRKVISTEVHHVNKPKRGDK